ncbi:J domain-containing protein [Streptomyces sp. NPDC059862]|uniref:J domain-containing protein n=1 Tax=unclassified Streptomyces TaxID=2593676 RepID=UPI00362FE148
MRPSVLQGPRMRHRSGLANARAAAAAQPLRGPRRPTRCVRRGITSACRRLVRSLHPDARPEEPAAADRLADVLAAYDTLGDPERRAAYDAGRGSPVSRTGAGRPVAVRVVSPGWVSRRAGSAGAARRVRRPCGCRPACKDRGPGTS